MLQNVWIQSHNINVRIKKKENEKIWMQEPYLIVLIIYMNRQYFSSVYDWVPMDIHILILFERFWVF